MVLGALLNPRFVAALVGTASVVAGCARSESPAVNVSAGSPVASAPLVASAPVVANAPLVASAPLVTGGATSTTSNAPQLRAYQLVGDRRLALSVEQNACSLIEDKPGSKPLRLLVPAPCDFHRDMAGNPRVLEANGKSIALVQFSSPSPDTPPDCVTVVQAVAVANGSLRVAPQSSRVAACPPFQWDEAMFLGPFEEP